MMALYILLAALSPFAGLWAGYSFWRLVRKEQWRSAGWEYGGWNGGAHHVNAAIRAEKTYGGLK